MIKKLLVFDTHPVQYRVPIWQKMNSLFPGCVHVVYASDCSVRGHVDIDFGRTFAWDEPMLTGYDYTILNCENGPPLTCWNSLTGKGVTKMIASHKPDAVLITGLNYKYDLMAYAQTALRGIPIWLRYETQDSAFRRTLFKSFLRWAVYKVAYLGISKAFFIGELNREHFLHHGIPPSKLSHARYSTVNKFLNMTHDEKAQLRRSTREIAKISSDKVVVGFSGKFIEKKNPQLLFEMLEFLPEAHRNRLHLYFVGSGPMERQLRDLAENAKLKYGIYTTFTGFVNQSQIAAHYLGMDMMILPSRRMGETWGLVANEAMQAGCSVIVSDAVGCGADFKQWERFLIFPEGNASSLAESVMQLSVFPRNFSWAENRLKKYTIEAVANSLLKHLTQQFNKETSLISS